jgi:hypothetical protein
MAGLRARSTLRPGLEGRGDSFRLNDAGPRAAPTGFRWSLPCCSSFLALRHPSNTAALVVSPHQR